MKTTFFIPFEGLGICTLMLKSTSIIAGIAIRNRYIANFLISLFLSKVGTSINIIKAYIAIINRNISHPPI